MTSIYQETLYQLTITQDDLDAGESSNSRYRFRFNGTKHFKNTKIALTNVQLFYSWRNITAALGNNTFSFIFTENDTPTQYDVTLPDGYYSVSDINTYLQSFMITNGLYLLDSNGDYVYYLELIENSTYYSVQFNAYPFPTALPAGYSNPAGMLFNTTATTPQLLIGASDAGFGTLIGFNAGTYPSPAQATTYSKLSDVTPQLNPSGTIFITCGLVNNKIANPPNVIFSFSPAGTAYGALIDKSPNDALWLDAEEGYYSEIAIQFLNQNFTALSILDTSNVSITLSFRTLNDFQP